MEKCPACNFHAVHEKPVLNSKGEQVGTESRCSRCGHLVRRTMW